VPINGDRTGSRRLAHDPGPSGSEARLLLKLKGVIGKMVESDRALFLDFTTKLAVR